MNNQKDEMYARQEKMNEAMDTEVGQDNVEPTEKPVDPQPK